MLILSFLLVYGCSLKTVERETAEETPAAPVENDSDYETALGLMDKGQFQEAAQNLTRFLKMHPTSALRGEALLNLSLCLFQIGRYDDVLANARLLLEDRAYIRDSAIQFRTRLVQAEAYLHLGKLKEALAVTFEIMARPLTKSEEARTKALRGRIYGELGRTDLAERSLQEALLALNGKSSAERKALAAEIARYRLEIIEKYCPSQNPVPPALSEREAIAYIEGYYECAKPARKYYCEVAAYKNAAILSKARQAYRNLATVPLKLLDKLPPPARQVRKEERKHYEAELRGAIEAWTEEKIKTFRNLDKCGAENIF